MLKYRHLLLTKHRGEWEQKVKKKSGRNERCVALEVDPIYGALYVKQYQL